MKSYPGPQRWPSNRFDIAFWPSDVQWYMSDSAAREYPINRKRAALAVLPFLLLGLADVVLLLEWGIDPLWGFMILPPILFMTALAWLAFRTGFARQVDSE
jgi:hypothetical protein